MRRVRTRDFMVSLIGDAANAGIGQFTEMQLSPVSYHLLQNTALFILLLFSTLQPKARPLKHPNTYKLVELKLTNFIQFS